MSRLAAMIRMTRIPFLNDAKRTVFDRFGVVSKR
jgi:hypothetical protein